MHDAVLDKVVDVVRREFPGAAGPIDGTTTAADVDGWDSVSHAMLVLSLEEAFGVELDYEATVEAPDLAALTAHVAERVSAAG